MTHKEKTAQIRKQVKTAGIKASVSMSKLCGTNIINVCIPSVDAYFTSDQLMTIACIAKDSGLTDSMNSSIIPSHESGLTGKRQFSYEYHA